jgi:hypothetical protein
MIETVRTNYRGGLETQPTRATRQTADLAVQATMVLYVGFVVLPIVAGLDKFFDMFANWDTYMAPVVANNLPFSAHTFMMIVGVVEMAAGVIVFVRPQIGAWVVAAWLLAIIGNLLLIPGHYDIALRDLGLSLGAIALARLSQKFPGFPWEPIREYSEP